LRRHFATELFEVHRCGAAEKDVLSAHVLVTLSSPGLANVQESQAAKSFEFRVNGFSYYCSPFVADFLSPRISRLHETDSTISLYEVQTADPEQKFADFLSFGRGRDVAIAGTSLPFFSSLAAELGN
jgi:hypothetical protein